MKKIFAGLLLAISSVAYSMLRPLRTSRGELSFLEYKISFGASADIPNQYMIIDASGRVNGYTRTRRILIPQITTNTALDFAVLQ